MVPLPAPFLSMDLLQREARAAPATQLSPPHQSGALSTTPPHSVVQGRQGQARHGCQTPGRRQPWSILLPWRQFEPAASQPEPCSIHLLYTAHVPSPTNIHMPLTPQHANATPAAEEFGDEMGERQQQREVLSITARSWGTEQHLKGFSDHPALIELILPASRG